MIKILFLITLTLWFIYHEVYCTLQWDSNIETSEQDLLEAEKSPLIKYFGKNAGISGVFLNHPKVEKIIGDYIDVDNTRFVNRNNKQMKEYISQIKEKCPNITHLYSIGKSVEGEELWVLVVSENPKKHTLLKPEFNYIGAIHGNEVLGRELLMLLAELLCLNYGKNTFLTKLVDTVRIQMLFSMNPDGYAKAFTYNRFSILGRNNANGIDLNRNFPPRFPDHERINGGDKLEIETQSVMKWMKNTSFVITTILHGGSLVAHYPFDDNSDGKTPNYTATADDKLLVQLAYQYARAHKIMWKSGKRCGLNYLKGDLFYHGILNGASWYPTSGAIDEWIYINTSSIPISIEMNCQKYPLDYMYEKLWNHNKYSLISLIDMARYGVKGIVESSNGEPLENVKVEIDESKGGKPIFTTSEGEYWRLLAPGIYTIKFSHPDYISKTLNISMEARKLIFENIILTPKEEQIIISREIITTFVSRN